LVLRFRKAVSVMFILLRDATVSGSHLEPYVTRWNSSTGFSASSTGLAASLSDESFAAFSSSALSTVFLMTVAASSFSLTLSIYNTNKGIVSECDVFKLTCGATFLKFV